MEDNPSIPDSPGKTPGAGLSETVQITCPYLRNLICLSTTPHTVDASTGLSRDDERMLAELGLGITNLVSKPTARADELTADELRAGGSHLVERVAVLQPRVVAILGITAFRTAFSMPHASLGPQSTETFAGWPPNTQLWAMPNPSGLNAHESIQTLAEKWAAVWDASSTP